MKTNINLRSLSIQMILSFIAVVLLTVATTGLPMIWIIRQQLIQQAWSQVEQGQNAVGALYASRKSELKHLAALTADRPVLHQLLENPEQDQDALGDYLASLQTDAGLDFIVVCSLDDSGLTHSVIAQTKLETPGSICNSAENNGFYIAHGEEPVQVWMVATHPVSDDVSPSGIPASTEKVVVGLKIDQVFIDEMSAQTGLEHSLLLNGVPVATSLKSDVGRQLLASQPMPLRGNPENMGSDQDEENASECWTFELDCQPYYAVRLSLGESDLEAEVALEVAEIAATQTSLLWMLFGTILAVAALGTGLGVLLARRISRPLVDLAGTASRFSSGHLSAPVKVEASVLEVVQVAMALENARVGLLRTLTDLRREKAWTSHLVESIVEGIVTLDQDLRITFFSHGAERITGWNRKHVLNRSCNQVFRLPDTDTPFSQVIPAPGQQNQLVVEVAGGRQVTLSLTGARFTPSEADESQVALVFRDITQEETIHRLLGHFMANVTHEFRTPLASLAAAIELLMDQGQDIDQSEIDVLLKSLHLGILSLQTLVDNLLESASIEAGHFRVSPRPADLGEIIDNAAGTMHPLLEKYGQRLSIGLPEKPVLVQADHRRISQVLVNLISNASKYGPADAEITISTQIEDECVKVIVSDQGPGVPSGLRGDLFRRFVYPASGSLVDNDPDNSVQHLKVGAGLGLSVVKAIVEAHGGQAAVQDRPGGGSIFWFTIPIAGEP